MPNFVVAFAVLIFVAACGSESHREPEKLEVPKYTEMKNVGDAPGALQAAARAIVLIEVVKGNHGTGTFVSGDGLLLTNNHVLGNDGVTCAREGCYITLFLDFQIGKAQEKVTVFAEPRNLSVASDATVFQLWTDGTRTRKFAAPHFLTIRPLNVEQLQRQTVHIIGHPNGALKKWTTGKVFNGHATWIYSTNFILPGSSGSPYLDDEGRIIGIVHRSMNNGEGRLSRRDLQIYSIGTASSELPKLLRGMRTGGFYSVNERRHSTYDIGVNHEAFLGMHQAEATLSDGTKTTVLSVLAKECDTALGRSDHSSPASLLADLQFCDSARYWIHCKDPNAGPGYISCPAGAERTAWKERWEKSAYKAYEGNLDAVYRRVISGWRLEDTKAAAMETESRSLRAFVDRVNPLLNFELTFYLIYSIGADARYRGQLASEFLKDYRNHPGYTFEYDRIIDGFFELFEQKVLDRAGIVEAARAMLDDERLSLEDKLDLEAEVYRHNLF